MNDLAACRLAQHASRAGRPECAGKSVEPLAGGRNNRVFRVDLEGGKAAVLKCYYHDPRDPRDRLAAEWSFLSYVSARGVRNVPRPLACDAAPCRALQLRRRRTGRHVDVISVRQAADFAVAINGAPREPTDLQPASEACFSLGGSSRDRGSPRQRGCATLTRTRRMPSGPRPLSRAACAGVGSREIGASWRRLPRVALP